MPSPEEEAQFTKAKDFGFLPIPRRLRYNPERPFQFGVLLNISFGLGSTFIVANLYYCQPLLIELSNSFHVSYSEVARIPTLVQAGYATGLLLLSPLGDLVRRRKLILCLVTLSTCITIGLSVTSNLVAFETLSFIVGVASVTPQVLIPLAADLAPPERRASAISIVLSGLLFGVLIARVLAGVIAQFISWRVVYYTAIGMQTVVLIGSYLILPDYPSKNDDLTYFHILWSMGKFACTEPLLIQSSLVLMAASAQFSNFWVTLTFLLGGPPYNYSTLVIGLFGLIGMFGVSLGPLGGRIIDKLVPWYAALFGATMLALFQSIQTGAGGISVAAVIISTLGLDIFRQTLQVSLTTAVFGIHPPARSRLNAVLILSNFIGQSIGTPVGTHIFVRYGWRADAALGMGFYAFLFVMLLLRGPHCQRYTWFGYEGGLEARKSVVEARKKAETNMAPLPTASDIEKSLESVVVGEKSEHEDEKSAEKAS